MFSALEEEELVVGAVAVVLCLILFVSCYVMTGRRTISKKARKSN